MPRRRSFSPRLEWLDARVTPADLPVTSLADAGAGSLRDCINVANGTAGPDRIIFTVAGAIDLLSALPPLTERVTIDGATAPGYAGTPLVVLNGAAAGAGANGLTFTGHGGSAVVGLAVQKFAGAGVLFGANSSGHSVRRCFIGTTADGSAAAGNAGGGVVSAAASNGGSAIGGTLASDFNVISGNGTAGVVAVPGDVVSGNLIGLNAAGTAAVPNAVGVLAGPLAVPTAVPVTIGGLAADTGNVISGNTGTGVATTAAAGFLVTVQGNRIGTNPAGATAIGNGGDGVRIENPGGATVGGPSAAGRNVVGGNSGAGVRVRNTAFDTFAGPVVQGNHVGASASGAFALGNSGVGIDVQNDKGAMPGLFVGGNVIAGGGGGGVRVAAAAGGPTVPSAVIEGNRVGTTAAGTGPLANAGPGVELVRLTDPRVGGVGVGTGNLVSANVGDGVLLTLVTNATVQGNTIGLTAAGTAALANLGAGVRFASPAGGLVGGTTAAARNVIAGNAASGVLIDDDPTATVVSAPAVFGNWIGVNGSGTAAVPNARHGVEVRAARVAIGGVRVGGPDAGAGNVISGNALDGVSLSVAGSGQLAAAAVAGNFIGTDPAGAAAIGNGGAGVAADGATGLRVGGPAAGERNVVSGNAAEGVLVRNTVLAGLTGPTIENNHVGVTAAGTTALPNGGHGVEVGNSKAAMAGVRVAGNVISGNAKRGLNLVGSLAAGADLPNAVVVGNRIGTDPTGATSIGNGQDGLAAFDLSGLTVGGPAAADANVIAGNAGAGLTLSDCTAFAVAGNRVGVSAALANGGTAVAVFAVNRAVAGTVGGAAAADGNRIVAKSNRDGVNVFASGGGTAVVRVNSNLIPDPVRGIVLQGTPAAAANEDQPPPTLTAASITADGVRLAGTVTGAPNAEYRVELFGDQADATLVGVLAVTTDPAGTAAFAFDAPGAVPPGTRFTATATRQASGATSPFAGRRTVTGGFLSGTVFIDPDRSGTRDAGEGPAANVSVFADVNGNGAADPTEATATTAADGTYRLVLPADGSYAARIAVPTGFLQTTGNPGAVQVAAGATAAGGAFGVADAVARLTASPAAANEGDAGTTDMLFTLTRGGDLQADVTVGYATQNGTAIAGADYDAKTGSVRFAPGQTTATVRIAVRGNARVQPDRVFSLVFSLPANATIQPADLVAGTIRDDDAPATLTPVTGTTPQVTPAGTEFGAPLALDVRNAAGTPVEGAEVTFRVPAVGPSGVFAGAATVSTDGSGRATAPALRATGTVGAFVVTATAGSAPPAAFELTTAAAPPTANRPPTISDVGDQRLAAGQSVGPIGFTVGDPDSPAGDLVVTAVSSNRVLLPQSGIALTANGAVRTLTLTAAADLAEGGTLTVTLTVTDPAGLTAADTFTVIVDPANRPPTVSDVGDRLLSPGAAGPAVGFTVGDAETPAGQLTVSASASDTTLFPAGSLTLGGGGADRTLTLTPAAGRTGSATITLTVTDAGGRTATDTFVATVAAAGTPPTISDVGDRRLAAGRASVPIRFTVGDAQTPAGQLAVLATSSDPELLPPGGFALAGDGADRTLVITPAAGRAGTATVTLTLTTPDGRTAADTFRVVVGPPTGLVGFRAYAAGADRGGPAAVTVFDPPQATRFTATPLPVVPGGVRVAVADFDADGFDDLAIGTGPGVVARVVVTDGRTGDRTVFAVAPFESFTGGVYVAAGDLDGDGRADLVITPDEGGGPRVDIYSGDGFTKVASFFGIDDPNFRGGARAAVGDLSGDGIGDLVVAAGFGGGPRVAAFDGPSVRGTPVKLFGDFFAFEQGLRNGVFVAAGDLDGDGIAELIAGGGPGGGPRVTAFAGRELLANRPTPVVDFFAGDTASRGGVRLAVKDLDGDLRADLLTGSGTGAGTRVSRYLGAALGPAGGPADAAFDAFPGVAAGVFVG